VPRDRLNARGTSVAGNAHAEANSDLLSVDDRLVGLPSSCGGMANFGDLTRIRLGGPNVGQEMDFFSQIIAFRR
jgi:hypothetical protein